MDTTLAQKAINAALSGNWEKAVELNSQILETAPNNVDALIRLARALAETGNVKKAKDTAHKALEVDPFNTIAKRSLEKWKELSGHVSSNSVISQAGTFLEEPGKTKITSLINIGDAKVIANIDSGDEVHLNPQGHRIGVTTMDGKCIGRLPDDLSARLRKLISLGNRYQVWVKSADKSDVKVFIRELFRSPNLADFASFTTEKLDYVSFTPPELVHDRQDIVKEVTTDEEE